MNKSVILSVAVAISRCFRKKSYIPYNVQRESFLLVLVFGEWVILCNISVSKCFGLEEGKIAEIQHLLD